MPLHFRFSYNFVNLFTFIYKIYSEKKNRSFSFFSYLISKFYDISA